MSDQCRKCGQFMWHWRGEHKCPPEFQCYLKEEETVADAVSVYAISPEDAAEQYRSERFYDEPSDDLMEAEVEVVVMDEKGKTQFFLVSGEPSVDWHVEEVSS